MSRIARVFLEGRVKDGEVFEKVDDKPFIIGKNLLLPELEKTLLALKPNEEKEVELSPEQAYGQRKPDLVRIIPLAAFKNSGQMPAPGTIVFIDENTAGKVQSVSGGRVRVDFNHPLASKTLVFKVKILKEVTENEEKMRALFEVFFAKAKPEDLKVKIADKNADLILPADCLKYEDFQARKMRFAQDVKQETGLNKISITEEF